MGNSDESPNDQTPEEIERKRLLHQRRQAHIKVRLGLSRRGSDNLSIQRRQSRYSELLSFHRQLATAQTNPIQSPFLACHDVSAKVQNHHLTGIQALRKAAHLCHERQRGERGSNSLILR